ncbi:hypothetical protein [Mailhella sp.]|uniref:hypothetical protein n=1 Tax=Mailhella sp. TaxID=1981029 RepID=UPI004064BDC4
MSEFVSLLDILEKPSYDGQRQLREEVAAMDFDLRRTMDAGLTPDEMQKAQAGRRAVHAALDILDKIFN